MRINPVQTISLRAANRPSIGWQWLKAKLRGGDEVANFNLASYCRLSGKVGCLPQSTERRAVQLRGNEVMRLTKISGFRHIEVRSGTIWLTGTPARGDVLLRPGEQLRLTNHWPFVLQAMEGAQIVLRS